jgi:MtN3 and saliva related transmembrane protein
MEITSYIGIAAGICSAVSSIPQLGKIIKEKKAENISGFMLGILLVGLALWIWYGILKDDYPIIITNSFSILVNLLIIFFTIRYKDKG